MTTECKSYSSHSSSSSSMDSSGHLPAAPTGRRSARCDVLSTDLQLGLSLSSSSFPADSTPSTSSGQRQETLFVKVYMEGVPIGRKIDLLLLEGYDGLLAQLSRMFKTNITYADVMDHRLVPRANDHDHVLTYEDQEGDWMMVGDVPWELFLTSVKKLRIARADKC